MKKRNSKSGETLVETLCAMLIVTVVMLCLSTAIVSAARVNAQVRQRDVAFHTEDMSYSGQLTMTVKDSSGREETFAVGEYVGSADAEKNSATYRYYGAAPQNGGN